MRSCILGIVILMGVPEFAVGQERDRSERSATGRTAIPRAESIQAVPAKQPDRRAERRGEANTPSAARTAPERLIEAQLRVASARAYPLMVPAISRHDPRQFPDREHPRPGHKDGDDRRRYRRPHSGANVVFVPYAAPVVYEREVVIEREFVDEAAGAPVIVEQPAPARLILDIHPPTAQVFTDGYYIGIPEDFRFEDGGAVLEPGPHRIDILARDYEPVTFDVNLTRGQSATYRHTLTPIVRAPQAAPAAAAKAPPAPKQPVTFYLIPGCYMGNVPPKEANLPATCDITRAVSAQY